ncbi:hypothetical protein AcW1_008522 [Taiwanofungus camphoratus]|nr:hypothetical protein AcW1_008522 [Antrodia cinnamomea]
MASYPAYGNSQAPLSNDPYANANPNAVHPYPPQTSRYNASSTSLSDESPERDSTFKKSTDVIVNMRDIRTPSPTPSEDAELKKTSVIDFQAMKNRKFWFRKEWTWYYVAFAIALVVVILITAFHKQIVNWLQPAANWMHSLPAGWLIPIAIFFVISFPPLFGHEIVAILCGLVWGLWAGFGIVAAGTFLGELANFYAFKYCCAARGEKLERSEISYACLARVVREGGFKVALIARFSAIPGHFTTAVFSTCGMGVWTFCAAAFLSLPKQFITVYLGVALEQSDNGGGSRADNIVKDVGIVLTTIITFAAMWYIYSKMNKIKPQIIYDRRRARKNKLAGSSMSLPYANGGAVLDSTGSVTFNPNPSDSEIPLNPTNSGASAYQQWDENGRAVGYAPDPNLYMPQPRRAPSRPPMTAPMHRPQEHTQTGSAYPMTAPVSQSASPFAAAQDSRPATALPHPDAAPVPRYTAAPVQATYSTPPPIPPPPQPHPQSPSQRTPTMAPAAFSPPPVAHAQFAAYPDGQDAGAPALPMPNPYSDPFSDPSHAPEPSAAALYSAQSGYSRAPPNSVPQAYTAYESTTSVQSQAGTPPPSYSNVSLR